MFELLDPPAVTWVTEWLRDQNGMVDLLLSRETKMAETVVKDLLLIGEVGD